MSRQQMEHYLRQLAASYTAQDGERTAQLLSFRDGHADVLGAALPPAGLQQMARKVLQDPDHQVAVGHITAVSHFYRGNLDEAFAAQNDAVKAFVASFSAQKNTNWGLDPLEVLTLDLRLLATRCDQATVQAGGKPKQLEAAMTAITNCFRAINSDRPEDPDLSKRWGMMFLVNHLLCIGFQLNNFAFLRSIRRVMDGDGAQRDQYWLAHRVTYSYYVGRKALFDAEYTNAKENLTFALTHCHKDSLKNKRLILTYLIPVNLLRGRLPSDELLQKYNLTQFADIAGAVRLGDLSKLRAGLDAHHDFFVQWGVLLILEKLQMLTYRNLFKRVVGILGITKIPLVHFLTALQFVGQHSIDTDEVECILANLIQQRYIKGYIAHQQRMLVVSAKEAFPPLQKD